MRRPAFAALASPGQFSEDMGPASPTVHNLANSFMSASGEGALGMMARAKELADLRQQVTTLEEENTRYRSIIADMRSQMEQLASGSASPAKASQQLAVTEAGWKQERQDLVAALTRQEQLVELLQRRMDEVRRGAFSDDAASTIAAGDMEVCWLHKHTPVALCCAMLCCAMPCHTASSRHGDTGAGHAAAAQPGPERHGRRLATPLHSSHGRSRLVSHSVLCVAAAAQLCMHGCERESVLACCSPLQ